MSHYNDYKYNVLVVLPQNPPPSPLFRLETPAHTASIRAPDGHNACGKEYTVLHGEEKALTRGSGVDWEPSRDEGPRYLRSVLC